MKEIRWRESCWALCSFVVVVVVVFEKTRGCEVTNVPRRPDSEYYNGRCCTIYIADKELFPRWNWGKTADVHVVLMLFIQLSTFLRLMSRRIWILEIHRRIILHEFGLAVKLCSTDILLEVQQSNKERGGGRERDHKENTLCNFNC